MSTFGELAAAYEGVERLETFADRDSMASYRQAALARTAPQAAFITNLLERPSRIVEIGSGNGRLLIELALRGATTQGLGVELSRSRTDFARQWAEEAGCSEHLAFRNGNALAVELDPGGWDAVICITGTFAYFDAIDPGSASRLLDQVHTALRPGGVLILELYPHPSERRLLAAAGNSIQTWRELVDDDPWRFYLSALTLRGDVLTHAKTFIHRSGGSIDEGRRERIVLYTPQTIAELLRASGFTHLAMRDGWSDTPYAHGEVLVVTASSAR